MGRCLEQLLLVSSVLVAASGVEIVRTSARQVTVRRGESMDLYCESVTPYQVERTVSLTFLGYIFIVIQLNPTNWRKLQCRL